MKKLLITTALAASLATVSVQASPSIAQDDMNQIFSTSSASGSFPVGVGKQSHQVAVLSEQEMKETEGAYFIPGAIVGGIVGAVSYTAYGLTSDTFSWSDFGLSTGTGIASGYFAGPSGWLETAAMSTGGAAFGAGWGLTGW